MGKPRYPWSKWFGRRKPWTLAKGKDFDCQTHAMAGQIRNAASIRGLRISIEINNDTIKVTNRGLL